MFIAHLKYDIPTLKACAATCFCWYNIAIPHLHRTLVLRGWTSKKYRNQRSDLLPSLFELGLLPFVEQLQFWGAFSVIFDSKNTRYLRAMVNLQTLTIGGLKFSKFPAGFGKHLGHVAIGIVELAGGHSSTVTRLLQAVPEVRRHRDIMLRRQAGCLRET